MSATPLNQEVLFAEGPLVQVDRQAIESLKGRASQNPRRRVRLCAHPAIEDSLHEMLIVHDRGAYVRPHKHARPESFHVIEGRGKMVVFEDHGSVMQVVHLGDYASGRTFYYRLADPRFHTLLIESDTIVFHESKNGPFNPSETTFPGWAPDGQSVAETAAYVRALETTVERFEESRPTGAAPA